MGEAGIRDSELCSFSPLPLAGEGRVRASVVRRPKASLIRLPAPSPAQREKGIAARRFALLFRENHGAT